MQEIIIRDNGSEQKNEEQETQILEKAIGDGEIAAVSRCLGVFDVESLDQLTG